MRRLNARWMLPALAAVSVLLLPQAAAAGQGKTEPRSKPAHRVSLSRHHSGKVLTLSTAAVSHKRSEVAWHRQMTWKWQDAAGVPRTHSSRYEARTRSAKYLGWLVRLWDSRRQDAKAYAAKIERQWSRMNGDFETAVRILAHRLGLDSIAGWVLSCADSEGGRGPWVPNRHGSGAGGWMQFMSGTYDNNSGAAWAFASSRGVVVPREYDSWYSPVGQALTALWMFHHEGSGQWSGSGC